MARRINRRELRSNSGEILRALDRGESFVVTRNGVPIGDLVPARRQQFVRAESVLAAFASLAPVDYERFLADLDGVLDQDPSPSG